MKSNLIIFILSVGLVISLYFLFKSKSEVSDITKALNSQQDSTHHWIDQFGKEHARTQSLELTSGEAQVVYGKKIDSISRELSISKNNIRGYTKESTNTNIDTSFKKTDTVYKTNPANPEGPKIISSLTGSFDDNWLHLNVTLGDQKRFKLHISDTTTAVPYSKGWFSNKLQLDIKHSSPYTKTDKIESIVIQNPTPRLEFGVFGGYGTSINSINFGPVIGIGIGYRIFSIGK